MYPMRKIKFLCLLFISLSYQLSFSQNPSVCDYLEKAQQVQTRLVQYFEKYPHDQHKSYNQRLLLLQLAQKHHLPLKLPKNYLTLDKIFDEDTLYLKYFERLINPKFKPKSNLQKDYINSHGIDHLLLWSLYSDKLAWDKECENTINQEVIGNEYNLRAICHYALAYYWVKSLNPKAQATTLQAFENQFEKWEKALYEGFKYVKGFTDSGIEGLLAFVFMGKFQQIPQKSLEEFLYYESPDGGYPWDTEKNTSNFHASLIALWLVSEMIEFCN